MIYGIGCDLCDTARMAKSLGGPHGIRRYRVKKDQKWTVDSEYGKIDITINLSKPEKDPKAIALF